MSIYTTITDKILEQLTSGNLEPWERPWTRSGAGGPPVNVKSRRPYRGVNHVLLSMSGYGSPVWGTFKQWKERGTPVKKGEKSTMIVFWKFGEEENDEGDMVKTVLCRGYFVFNAEQVDGYVAPAAPAPVISEAERIEAAEKFFEGIGATVEHVGEQACYIPSVDRIRMPKFEQFKSPEHYYSVLGHEHIHWTGSDARLARQFGKRFGDFAYAAEELVAEIGAAFLMGHLGLADEPRADHAKYLAHWIRLMKSDSKAIFTAASKAQEAVDFLIKGSAAEEVDTEELEAA